MDSFYRQILKEGRTIQKYELNDKVCNYYKSISMWSKYFGKENINVRVFDRNNFVGGNIYTNFMSLLNIDHIYNKCEMINATNIGNSDRAIKCLETVNPFLLSTSEVGVRERFYDDIIRNKLIDMKNAGAKNNVFDINHSKKIIHRYKRSNNKVYKKYCADYINDRDTLFAYYDEKKY